MRGEIELESFSFGSGGQTTGGLTGSERIVQLRIRALIQERSLFGGEYSGVICPR